MDCGPSVTVIVGSDIDASAAPPTYERNRYVADMLLHYSCRPFFRASDEVRVLRSHFVKKQPQTQPRQQQRRETDSLALGKGNGARRRLSLPLRLVMLQDDARGTTGEAAQLASAGTGVRTPDVYTQRRLSTALHPPSPSALNTKLFNSATGHGTGHCRWLDEPLSTACKEDSAIVSEREALNQLNMWSGKQPPSDIFHWCTAPLPPVGVEELNEYHDRDYIRFLTVRESLSEVDERAASAKRQRAETMQPVFARGRRRSSQVSPSATPATLSTSAGVEAACSAPSPKAELKGSVSAEAVEMAWLAPRPPRELPDLIPIEQDETYGTVHDAAPFLGMLRTLQSTVSGSLAAARWLLHAESGNDHPARGTTSGVAVSDANSRRQDARFAALHWFGGRHHAKRDLASGFCFFNDVVLAAMLLHRGMPMKKNKILIIDIDAHHGDGTQEAFFYDDNYFTLSIHGYGTGFFPGSGGEDEVGGGLAKGFCANVPLPEGATDQIFVPLARNAIRVAVRKLTGLNAVDATPLVTDCAVAAAVDDGDGVKGGGDTFIGEARANPPHDCGSCLGGIVLVCGADGVQGDAIGRMNYTVAGLQCVSRLVIETALQHDAKLLVLGAGGYVNTSAARVAGVVTRDVLSAATARRLSPPEKDPFFLSPFLKNEEGVPVPDTCAFFSRYGPSFLMHGIPDAVVPKVHQVPVGAPSHKAWHAFKNAVEDKKREAM